LDQLDDFIAAMRERCDAWATAIDEAQKKLDTARETQARLNTSLQTLIETRERLSDDQFPLLEKMEIPVIINPRDLQLRGQTTLPPDEVASHARAVLIESGRPMRRGQLVRALLARNVPLSGTDKNKNLGTILWRHKDQFVSLEKLGYWVKDVPLPGVYEPEE
jgi:hypothetical protein